MNLELYHRVRQGGTGIARLKDRALWSLSGADRIRYLNGQVTNDVAKLPAGKTLLAAVTTAKGKMVGDIFVASAPDRLLIDGPLAARETLGMRLEKYIIADDAGLEDLTDSWTLSHFFGSPAPEPTSSRLIFPNARFGIPGFDVWESSPASFEAPVIDEEICQSLRVESGLPQWGSEMTEETLPPEAGLDRNGISYTKGCYVGQETMARIKSIGHVNKTLVCLQSKSNSTVAPETPLTIGSQNVGRITSTAFSPALQNWIALGYVQRQHARTGEIVSAGSTEWIIIEPPLKP